MPNASGFDTSLTHTEESEEVPQSLLCTVSGLSIAIAGANVDCLRANL